MFTIVSRMYSVYTGWNEQHSADLQCPMPPHEQLVSRTYGWVTLWRVHIVQWYSPYPSTPQKRSSPTWQSHAVVRYPVMSPCVQTSGAANRRSATASSRSGITVHSMKPPWPLSMVFQVNVHLCTGKFNTKYNEHGIFFCIASEMLCVDFVWTMRLSLDWSKTHLVDRYCEHLWDDDNGNRMIQFNISHEEMLDILNFVNHSNQKHPKEHWDFTPHYDGVHHQLLGDRFVYKGHRTLRITDKMLLWVMLSTHAESILMYRTGEHASKRDQNHALS